MSPNEVVQPSYHVRVGPDRDFHSLTWVAYCQGRDAGGSGWGQRNNQDLVIPVEMKSVSQEGKQRRRGPHTSCSPLIPTGALPHCLPLRPGGERAQPGLERMTLFPSHLPSSAGPRWNPLSWPPLRLTIGSSCRKKRSLSASSPKFVGEAVGICFRPYRLWIVPVAS